MPLTKAQIESAARGDATDMRLVLNHINSQLETLNGATGISMLQSTNGSLTSAATSTPAVPQMAVTAANGAYAITITPVAQPVASTTVYYEVSYSASASFSGGVTVMPIATSTTLTLASPGQTLFFRIRASYDRKTWSTYYKVPQAVASGLQTSAATSPNIPLNQSNFAIVDSIVQGGVVVVRVYGSAGGPGTPWVTAAGRVLPSASLIGQTPGSDAVVAYDPDAGMYRVKDRIADVFPDSWIVVGQVSIVQTATPSLPVIVPIVQDGHVIAYNVTDGGNGISAPLNLTVNGIGTGATTGQQTIQGGQLKSVAPGNPGENYDGSTTVAASGGVYAGSAGGGGTDGGNGGRLTAI